MIYPISEIFVSPQGEGQFAGTMMCFVRLAGCTVGKPFPKEEYMELMAKPRPALPIYTEQCTLYDGREFPCDTDYRVKERMTVGQIIDSIPENVKHVCITGGEPLMHPLSELFTYLVNTKKKVHIETSGTIYADIPAVVWVTVSPKKDVLYQMLNRADEIKILVDRQFDPDQDIPTFNANKTLYVPINLAKLAEEKLVYIQPVNAEHIVNQDNLKLCMELQKKYPQFRLSLQLHKVLSAEVGELVR